MSLCTFQRTRRRLSGWMVAMLLLAQGLLAAYACPALATGAAPVAGELTSALPACHDSLTPMMDGEQPTLCKAHCTADAQAPAQCALDDLPPAAPAAGFDALVPAPLALAPVGAGAAPELPPGGPPGWPPIYLLHGVLRI